MKRRTEFPQINTLDHWNSAHINAPYPYPGLDTYLTLTKYYRYFLIDKGYPDIFGFGPDWLDYGCGNAAKRLQVLELPAGVEYAGCDFAQEVLKENRKQRPDLQWLSSPEQGKQYNIITSIHTFEHLDDPQKSWDKLWPFVKDVLVVQVPYKESFYSVQHPWEFDENSFQTPVPPVVIVGPKLDLEGDREICYVWYKNHAPKQRVVYTPYQDQFSPQGWFLWHHKLGISWYYWPMMFGKKFGFLKKTKLYKYLKKQEPYVKR